MVTCNEGNYHHGWTSLKIEIQFEHIGISVSEKTSKKHTDDKQQACF